MTGACSDTCWSVRSIILCRFIKCHILMRVTEATRTDRSKSIDWTWRSHYMFFYFFCPYLQMQGASKSRKEVKAKTAQFCVVLFVFLDWQLEPESWAEMRKERRTKSLGNGARIHLFVFVFVCDHRSECGDKYAAFIQCFNVRLAKTQWSTGNFFIFKADVAQL